MVKYEYFLIYLLNNYENLGSNANFIYFIEFFIVFTLIENLLTC